MTRALAAAALACTSACIAIPSPPACVVRPLTEVNSTKDEGGSWLSPDHLELFFASTRNSNPYQIYRSTRPSVDAQFSSPVLQFNDGSKSYEDPFLSDDGLTMWLAVGGAISVVTRPDRTSDFSTTPDAIAISLPPNNQHHPSVTADQLTLVLVNRFQIPTQLYSMTRMPGSALTAFGNLQRIDALDGGDDPTIARDGTSLLFDAMASDGTEVHRAVRGASGFVDGGPVTALGHVVGSDDSDGTPDSDGHTIVFASNRIGGVGGYDLWIACE